MQNLTGFGLSTGSNKPIESTRVLKLLLTKMCLILEYLKKNFYYVIKGFPIFVYEFLECLSLILKTEDFFLSAFRPFLEAIIEAILGQILVR